MANTMTAQIILQQLGGGRFIAMTGCKHFVALENGLRCKLAKNASKANFLQITLNGLDLYDIKFTYFRAERINFKTGKITPEKYEVIAEFNNCYFDVLPEIFTRTTGMFTHF